MLEHNYELDEEVKRKKIARQALSIHKITHFYMRFGVTKDNAKGKKTFPSILFISYVC